MPANLKNSSILQTKNVMKAVEQIVPDTAEYKGLELMPIVSSDRDRVAWDIRKAVGGMTQVVGGRSVTPQPIQGGGVAYREFDPAFFIDTVPLTADDLYGIRRLGTVNDVETAASLIARWSRVITNRAFARAEWCNWQALRGSLAINENGANFTVSYDIPGWLQPTVATAWSTVATADPLGDIFDWKILLEEGSGIQAERLWINSNTMKNLLENTNIKSDINTLVTGVQILGEGQRMNRLVSRETVQAALSLRVGTSLEVIEYDKGIFLFDNITAAVASGATTVTVRDATYLGIAAGDIVVLENTTLQLQERKTVSSLSGNVITLTSTTTNAYDVGGRVRKYVRFIPNDVAIMTGAIPSSAEGGTTIGNFVSVNAPYGNGNLQNPKPGIFAEVKDHSDDVPPTLEVVGGIFGLPVLFHPEAVLVANVA